MSKAFRRSASRGISAEHQEHLARRDRATLLGLRSRDLTWRGFCVGSLLSFFLATSAPYANMVLTDYVSAGFDTRGGIFLFLLLTGVLNLLFKLAGQGVGPASAVSAVVTGTWVYAYQPFDAVDLYSPGLIFSSLLVLASLANLFAVTRGRSIALNRSELILVYAMMLIVSALCTMGMSEQLPGIICAIFYYASPENRWAERLFPHLDKRVVVDDGAGNALFFEGVGGGKIPYDAWIEPLLWWAVFLFALYVTMVSIAVILRRQWMERERLAYPVVQVGLAMIRGEESDRLVNRFFKRPSMWIGWSIPMFVGLLGALQSYGINVPKPSLSWNASLLGVQPLVMSINFVALGFSYLIHTHLALGICVFHMVAKFQKAFFQIAGIKSSQTIAFGVAGFPLLGYQGTGALIGMVLVGLWIGRGHLKTVVLKAAGLAPHVDDGDEIMSYRSAVFGVVGGVLVMATWLWIMGTPAWISLLFVIAALLIFIGITRIVVEAGLVLLRAPICAPDLVIQGVGSSLIGPTGVMNLSLAYLWAADVQVFVMGTCANALKMIEEMDRRSRRLVFWGIILALLIGALGSLWMIFHLTYQYGGINMNGWFFKSGPATAYQNAVRNLQPRGVYWPGLGFFAGGGVVMALMMFARARLSWWPLHPIGFPIGANPMTDGVWFSVFLAWAVKVCVLRLGGGSVYHRSVPFFLGILSGEVTSMGVWLVADYFTGNVGYG